MVYLYDIILSMRVQLHALVCGCRDTKRIIYTVVSTPKTQLYILHVVRCAQRSRASIAGPLSYLGLAKLNQTGELYCT